MAEKLSIKEAKDKLVRVNLAIKQLVETRSKSGKTLDKLIQLKEVKTSLVGLLKESGEATALVQSTKGNITTIPVHSDKELKDLSTHKDVKAIEKLTGEKVKGTISEEKREYTAEESRAVGEALLKPLEAAIRSTKGELPMTPEVTGHTNKFSVHAVYGHDKGEDTFVFTLNPDDSTIYLKSGREEQVVAPFEVTQANQVNINPEINLEEVLKDLMTKYVPEPTDQDYDAQAEMEPSHDESQINKFIAERKLALRESLGKSAPVGAYVKDFEKSNKPQFKGKSKEKRDQMAVAAALQAQKGTMKEDIGAYVGEPDNEPHMLKADVYKILKAGSELYKMLEAIEQQGSVDFPQWIQAKIIEATDNILCAKDYLEFETQEPQVDQAINTLGEELIDEVVFKINGLGTYTSTKRDADTITGVDQGGTTRTFSKKKVELDNPGIFDRQPREKKPQGIRPYTESQYRKILQGAIDDVGSTEFAYDIADSMIHDPQILAKLKKDYPGESAKELKQQLQWNLEACDAPEEDYEDDDENYDN